MKKELVVTKKQLERLIEQVHNQKYRKPIKEGFMDTPGRGPGESAAEGMDVVVDALKRAWKYVTDPETRKKVRQALESLGEAAGDAVSTGTRESRTTNKPVISNSKPSNKLVRPTRK